MISKDGKIFIIYCQGNYCLMSDISMFHNLGALAFLV